MKKANKSVVATADNVSSSLRSGRPFSAVPHFKRSAEDLKALCPFLVIVSLYIPGLVHADQVVVPDPWKSKEYSVLAIDGRFAAYIGWAPVLLDSRLRDKEPKTYLEAIESFGPAFTSRSSSSGTWEWHFDDGMIYRVDPKWSGPLSDPVVLNLKETYMTLIHDRESKAEQGGAGQPATQSRQPKE